MTSFAKMIGICHLAVVLGAVDVAIGENVKGLLQLVVQAFADGLWV